jgi:RNA-binding protein
MRLSSLVVAGTVLLGPSLAAGDTPRFVVGEPTIDDLQFALQPIPPTGTSGVAQSRIIYLNKGGVSLAPGANDARTNHSSMVTAQTAITGWNPGATTWTAVVGCMRELFAGFDVTIVETDPGSVPHIEAVFGGSPTQFGLGTNVGGLSPFTTDCAIIENSIVFAFTQVIPNNARTVCEIMAQEVAHSFGLDHELLARDPMTYLAYDGNRSFQNQNVSCGESTARPCGIEGSTCRTTQNSMSLLIERLGRRGAPGDVTPPTIGITSPANNATVPPGFAVTFDAADVNGVKFASIYIDGQPSGSVSSLPYTFTTPATLFEGKHELRVEVTDGANQRSQVISVTVKKGAAAPPPPAGGGDDDVLGGCSTTGTDTGTGTLLAAVALLGLRRRRRRERFLAPARFLSSPCGGPLSGTTRAVLSGKQRRHLRALGHALRPVVQLGKGGIDDGLIAAIDQALVDHELVKVRVGESAELDRHEAAAALATRTRSEVAQVLGNTVLLYRAHPEEPEIVLPR